MINSHLVMLNYATPLSGFFRIFRQFCSLIPYPIVCFYVLYVKIWMSLFLIKISTNLSCLSPYNTSYYETNKRNVECCNFTNFFFSANQEFIPKLPSQGKLELKNPSVMFRTITTSYEDYKETKKTL